MVPGETAVAPKAPNLTQLARLRWSEEDFIKALRTGINRFGRQLDSEFMPWDRFKNLTDDELTALWLYLSSLEPREFEQ